MLIRLVAVDRHTLARLGLAHAIADVADIDLVGEAETASQARRRVAELAPTVVTIDAHLPDLDGITLAQELRRKYPALGIVLLAASDNGLLMRALQAELSAFVMKTAMTSEILAAIRHAAVASTSFTAPGLAAAISARHQPASVLSPRESEVLLLLRDGETVRGIATTLAVSESTVKTYVTRLYDKLEANNRAQALMTAIRRGLLHDSDSSPAIPA